MAIPVQGSQFKSLKGLSPEERERATTNLLQGSNSVLATVFNHLGSKSKEAIASVIQYSSSEAKAKEALNKVSEVLSEQLKPLAEAQQDQKRIDDLKLAHSITKNEKLKNISQGLIKDAQSAKTQANLLEPTTANEAEALYLEAKKIKAGDKKFGEALVELANVVRGGGDGLKKLIDITSNPQTKQSLQRFDDNFKPGPEMTLSSPDTPQMKAAKFHVESSTFGQFPNGAKEFTDPLTGEKYSKNDHANGTPGRETFVRRILAEMNDDSVEGIKQTMSDTQKEAIKRQAMPNSIEAATKNGASVAAVFDLITGSAEHKLGIFNPIYTELAVGSDKSGKCAVLSVAR